jgi:hypothetical protein
MSRFRILGFSALTILVWSAFGTLAVAQPQGPITIVNGEIRLTINPSVGRAVDYGRVGKPNLLRITDSSVLTTAKANAAGYQAYGGDVLWPAQQNQWGGIRGSGGTWPPLNELDGPNWTVVDQSDSHVTIQSPQGPLLGLVARRRFELVPNSTEVVITNTFERKVLPARVAQYPVLIWSVTGVVEPEFTLAGVSPDRPIVSTYVTLNNTNPTSLVTNLNSNTALRFNNRSHGPGQAVGADMQKLGMYGDWLAAIYANDIFLQRTEYDPQGLFPDNANTEIYSAQATGGEHVELEVLSGGKLLQVGELMTNIVHWHLLDRPEGASDAVLALRLAAVPEPVTLLLLGCGSFAFLLRRGNRPCLRRLRQPFAAATNGRASWL